MLILLPAGAGTSRILSPGGPRRGIRIGSFAAVEQGNHDSSWRHWLRATGVRILCGISTDWTPHESKRFATRALRRLLAYGKRIRASTPAPIPPRFYVSRTSTRSPSSRRFGRITSWPRKALENGKHVFVEKPFTSNAPQAEELIELAARKKLTIMVDHTFLFTGAVRKIRELTESGALGDLYYYDSLRVNLGLFQHDVSVLWDLAPHDLSIMDHLIKGEPEADRRHRGEPPERRGRRRLHHDLLSPKRDRTHQCQLALTGEDPDDADRRPKKMLVWNDLVADEKIRVYDKGVQIARDGRESKTCW